MTIFNEKTLQDEIHRVWGAYGAHADVYAHILRSNADMLEALESLVDWLDDGNRVLSDACEADVSKARAAIAKAKGKT